VSLHARSIYHLVTASELRAGVAGRVYRPLSLESEGFVHCSLERAVLALANDYFAEAGEPLIVLAIDPTRLSAEVRYEAPAPIAGGGTQHLQEAPVFPHVYGPIDLDSVSGAGVLEPSDAGYAWPRQLVKLDELLVRPVGGRS